MITSNILKIKTGWIPSLDGTNFLQNEMLIYSLYTETERNPIKEKITDHDLNLLNI